MQEIQRQAEILRICFGVCAGLGGLWFLIAAVLFFLFDIRKIWNDRTGRSMKKAMKKMEECRREAGAPRGKIELSCKKIGAPRGKTGASYRETEVPYKKSGILCRAAEKSVTERMETEEMKAIRIDTAEETELLAEGNTKKDKVKSSE